MLVAQNGVTVFRNGGSAVSTKYVWNLYHPVHETSDAAYINGRAPTVAFWKTVFHNIFLEI